MSDKENMKEEIVSFTNNLLGEYNENYKLDALTVMNAKGGTTLLGNIRISREENVKEIKEKLNNELKKYGETQIRTRHVVPCCALPYDHLSFNISI